ncbi:Gnt-I system low-affinity gluconate transporter [Kushneria sinocarnis]|uniref:Gnt-I system low-affinity gluconate transporter n=1 Tax=Kushneria sinocarnis TaxID=595502 RepID=A0A420WU74_9GAMM|nr:gluconate:H+ symporter [Kushneria sinocarnis]RKQ96985.1 Gnt-I system low-affinity gluconate transporter [Kushneria sinocarnis]
MSPHDLWLIGLTAASIVVLLILVMVVRIHALVALLLASICVAVGSGMPLAEIMDTVEKGMGSTLGSVAIIIGLGGMFGKMLEVSGGIDRLASSITARLGEERAHWGMGLAGLLVGIPVFFDVGFIILVPMIYALQKRTGKSLLLYGIPLLAGFSVAHKFIPPQPGPITVSGMLGADLGLVVLFGLITSLPVMVLCGPIFGRFIARRMHVEIPEYMHSASSEAASENSPGVGTVVGLILLPLMLILLHTVSNAVLADESALAHFLIFIGDPISALIITVLATVYMLRRRFAMPREQVMEICTRALEPVGIIILVTGAGGVFKQTLGDSGVGDVIGSAMAGTHLPPLLLGFLIAAVIRVIQGSATVSMITAAGLIAPLMNSLQLDAAMTALMVIAIGGGSTVLSHVNDSGFWLVNRYLGLSEKDTLKSWTVMETLIGLSALVMAMLIALFV